MLQVSLVDGAFLNTGLGMAIQSYYPNHKEAAFTLGLITVKGIKSHFAAEFKTSWRPKDSSFTSYYLFLLSDPSSSESESRAFAS